MVVELTTGAVVAVTITEVVVVFVVLAVLAIVLRFRSSEENSAVKASLVWIRALMQDQLLLLLAAARSVMPKQARSSRLYRIRQANRTISLKRSLFGCP